MDRSTFTRREKPNLMITFVNYVHYKHSVCHDNVRPKHTSILGERLFRSSLFMLSEIHENVNK